MRLAGVVPPAVTEAMRRHSGTGYMLALINEPLSICIVLFLLQSGFTAALARRIRKKLPANENLKIAAFVFIFIGAYVLCRLPFAFYNGYQFPHSYGLSNQSVWQWFGEWIKFVLLESTLGAFCFALVIAVMRRFRRRWVFVLWLALSFLLALMIFVEPLVIEPLFNKFVSMPDNKIHRHISAIATAAGVKNAPVFVVDKSQQTRTINAYVTGIGSSARIVIWDNTLKFLPEDQLLAVVAHESGHYAIGHIYWGFVFASGSLLVLLIAIELGKDRLIDKLPKRWEVYSLTDINAIPVIMLVILAGSFLSTPVVNFVSRTMEHQADAFGLHITGDGPAMARAFVSLSEQNLSDPDPPLLVQLWLFSHPTLKDRILFCLN